MFYRDFQGMKLSALGLGCMRLPTFGKNADVNKEETRKLVALAMEKGINYYDTAYGYHGGNSERVMGEILASYPRESFYLADKFPGYDLSYMDKVEEIFEEQLARCGVEYFDFYLFHNVNEKNIDYYLDPKYRIHSYLMEQKRRGRIRHLGFSVHGNLDTTRRFLASYGKDMEFCQVQLNYLDFHLQNARGKLELLKEYGIPVWVMEPLRGGKLCSLEAQYKAKLAELSPHESEISWAFRFLQSIPEVTVVLSGMSNLSQLKENISYFEKEKPLSEDQRSLLLQIAQDMTAKTTLPCTGCQYCTSSCPMELNIPWIIELYNEHSFSGGGWLAPMALESTPAEKRPGACIGCGACEALCPQNIKISEMMKRFDKMLQK